jgi:hypothetical protein
MRCSFGSISTSNSLEYLNNYFKNKGSNYKMEIQFYISYISGLSVSLLTIPIWTIRTRLSLLTLDKIGEYNTFIVYHIKLENKIFLFVDKRMYS